MRARTLFLMVCGVSALTLACKGRGSAPTPTGASSARTQATVANEVVATVNGTPIREVDVLYKLKNDSHQTEMKAEYRQNLVEAIVREQLVYERAVQLGLDKDVSYQDEVQKLEAQVAAMKRKALGELFFKQEIAAKADVSETEAKKYFDEHEAWFRTDLHVMQILRRTEASIEEARAALAKGTSFDEVARGDLPGPAPVEGAQKPWDLGFVKLSQVPEPWHKVVEGMKDGETSGVIRGPKGRFWIIKLVTKRQGPPVEFASVAPALVSRLKAAKIEELRDATDRKLREAARVEFAPTAASASR